MCRASDGYALSLTEIAFEFSTKSTESSTFSTLNLFSVSINYISPRCLIIILNSAISNKPQSYKPLSSFRGKLFISLNLVWSASELTGGS